MSELKSIIEKDTQEAPTSQPLDVAFSVKGDFVPMDHGYVLYAALSRVLPWLHEATGVGIHPLHGEAVGGKLKLKANGELQIRLAPERLGTLAPLIGANLELGGHGIELGTFRVFPLRPRAALRSMYVTIKGFTEPEGFLAALQRQAETLDVQAVWSIGRRQVKVIQGKKVVGFEVLAEGLSPDSAMRLQARGIGGRRKMGAGIFVPARPRVEAVNDAR